MFVCETINVMILLKSFTILVSLSPYVATVHQTKVHEDMEYLPQ